MPPLDRRQFLGYSAIALAGAGSLLTTELGRDDARVVRDWAARGRYAADNRALLASGVRVDTVFLGDSITEGWQRTHPGFFPPGRACRGIGGQTTPQMVLRMPDDVLQLKPRRLHVLGGTNDIAGNTGRMDIDDTVRELRIIVDIARGAGIHVLLASVTPSREFFWRPGLDPSLRIVELNRRLEALARGSGCTWVDYHTPLADDLDGIREAYSDDGCHPNGNGYRVMEQVFDRAMRTLRG